MNVAPDVEFCILKVSVPFPVQVSSVLATVNEKSESWLNAVWLLINTTNNTRKCEIFENNFLFMARLNCYWGPKLNNYSHIKQF